jgi:SAM-dependent methyltransferase
MSLTQWPSSVETMTHMQQHDQHDQHDQHAPAHDSHQHQDAGADDYFELLDLDADVLHDYWSAALTWVSREAAGAPRTRLLDLGAGTGTGAIGLARHFPDAEVVAVDVSPDSLARLRAKTVDLGLASRVSTVAADLDAGWPDLGSVDLTWASMSMHHMADPDRVLRDVLDATRPGGLIAVAEFSQPLRFLADDLGFGRPGFETRAADVLGQVHTELMPALGSAWAPRLAEAGWTVIAERDFAIDLNPPSHPDANRYAGAWFARLAPALGDRLEPADRAVLAALLDQDGPQSLARRTDLHLRGVRSVTLGHRG